MCYIQLRHRISTLALSLITNTKHRAFMKPNRLWAVLVSRGLGRWIQNTSAANGPTKALARADVRQCLCWATQREGILLGMRTNLLPNTKNSSMLIFPCSSSSSSLPLLSDSLPRCLFLTVSAACMLSFFSFWFYPFLQMICNCMWIAIIWSLLKFSFYFLIFFRWYADAVALHMHLYVNIPYQ
jgi:hypothetical protein